MLPELPVRYGDFAAFQREQLAGDRLAEPASPSGAGRLAGAPARLDLPLDRPRPALPRAPRRRGSSCACPAPLAERLRALAAASEATPFMALLAGFGVLLSRLSGQAGRGDRHADRRPRCGPRSRS